MNRSWYRWGACGLLLLLLGCHYGYTPARPAAQASRTPATQESAVQPTPESEARPSLGETIDAHAVELRMRYVTEPDAISFMVEGPARVIGGNGQAHSLASGVWRLEAQDKRPALQRHHVFPKTFQPGEEAALEAYLKSWRDQGYEPQVERFGAQFHVNDGRVVDNRIFWVSLARFGSAGEAEAMQQRLSSEESVWAWTRPETVRPGSATIALVDDAGNTAARLPTPLRIETEADLHVAEVDSGYWNERRDDRVYPAPLELDVGPGGILELTGHIPLEEYLRGVLPAEMPASWPLEALKAQAVAARSEVMAAMAGKHRLEGFDFCATECCRAYRGLTGHQPSTDAALRATEGEVMVADGKIVPTVYSACCGGWTEDNENVWSGPLNPVLRGVADMPPGSGNLPMRSQDAVQAWLGQSGSHGYCSGSPDFRWSRTLTRSELSNHVNQQHAIGTVQRLESAVRGVSGRLRSLRVVGSKGAVTLDRELNIRRAFGGLPSALVVWQVNGDGSYTFRGAGRGHGVGLCQHGARGMSDQGLDYRQILTHYFTGVALERIHE